VIIVVTDDPRDALRVAGALGLLERWCRTTGTRMPTGLGPVVHVAAPGTTPPAAAPTPDIATAPVLLTYREAASRLNTSLRTVERLVARGELPGRRIGRRRYITPADIDAFVATLGRTA
jgi:excisionase family DNA binding protein